MFVKCKKTALTCNMQEWTLGHILSYSICYLRSDKVQPLLLLYQIANTVTEVFQTLYAGMSNASSVIIGKTLGRGEKDLAYKYQLR